MKYNYPIKYAAMPIKEQVGWAHGLHELEKRYDVVCYIVSRCYLLSDKTKYKENGQNEKEYEVVFPYQKGDYYDWQRVTPSFNIFDHACTNSNFVEKVFDTYEEALEFSVQKNKEIFDKILLYLPYTNIDDFKKLISEKNEEFNDILSKYKMLEQQILVNTSDLDQFKVRELNKLILVDEGKAKIISRSLYEYLDFCSSSKFIVYSISLEQYDKLKKLINSQTVFDVLKGIQDAIPILYHEEREKNTMVINQSGDVLYYIDDYGTLKSNDEQKIPSIELDRDLSKIEYIFTTETLEDVVVSFNVSKTINLNKIQGPILRKTLFDKN